MTAEEALRALCGAWENLDASAVGALFAQDGRYEDPLFEGVLTGPDEVRMACEPAIAELAEVKVEFRRLLAEPDYVLAEGTFLSKLVNGGRLDFELAMAVETRDGKIVRFTEYFDPR